MECLVSPFVTLMSKFVVVEEVCDNMPIIHVWIHTCRIYCKVFFLNSQKIQKSRKIK